MTTIAAYISKEENRVYMASDSIGANDTYKEFRKDSKIIKIPKTNPRMLIGVAGNLTNIQALQKITIIPPKNSNWETMLDFVETEIKPHLFDFSQLEGFSLEMLIAFDGRIFGMQYNFALSELDRPYNAIGTGRDYTIGALFALESVYAFSVKDKLEIAIGAAADNDLKTGGRICVEYV